MKKKLLAILVACALQITISHTSHAEVIINNHNDFRNFIMDLYTADISNPLPERFKDKHYPQGLDAFIKEQQQSLPSSDQHPLHTYLGFIYTNASNATIKCDNAVKLLLEIKTGALQGHIVCSYDGSDYQILDISKLQPSTTQASHELAINFIEGNLLQSSSVSYDIRSCNKQSLLRNGFLAYWYANEIIILGSNGSCNGKFEGHTSTINSVIQLKNGLLASAAQDNTVKIWNVYPQEVQDLSIIQYVLLKKMEDYHLYYNEPGSGRIMPTMHPDWIEVCLSLPVNVQIKFKELLDAHHIDIANEYDNLCEDFSELRISSEKDGNDKSLGHDENGSKWCSIQ